MHPNFADGDLPLQAGVGLTWMAVTPRSGGYSVVAPSVAEAMEAGFSQHWTKIRPICLPRRRRAVGVAPVPTRSGPQVTNPGYPGLSQFIW